MWAVIGGSGFEKFEAFEGGELLARETPFGMASSGLKRVRVAGHEAIFVSRHGEHHELLPAEINYRANIFALKRAGARAIASFSAVGSLRAEHEPGNLVIPLQYIDRTKGVRRHTFCGEGVVGHMSLAHPVCVPMAKLAGELAGRLMDSGAVHVGGTYVCIEGPNFSTLAESLSYRDYQADIIGMTNFPEYALAREAGLSYLPCCFVTDYDCWDTARPHVTVAEVIAIMKANNVKGFKVLQTLLANEAKLLEKCDCHEHGLKSGLMTSVESLSVDQRAWLGVLTSS